MTDALIMNALKKGSKPKIKAKPLKEVHVKEQTDGKYHVTRHSGKPSEPAQENTVNSLEEAHQAMDDHLAPAPDDADAEADAQPMGAGQPGMGGQ
jgi:hypothetical protein